MVDVRVCLDLLPSEFYCCMLLISICFLLLYFFFFKQKTAYEVRISDWSSDVCSSDLNTFLRFAVPDAMLEPVEYEIGMTWSYMHKRECYVLQRKVFHRPFDRLGFGILRWLEHVKDKPDLVSARSEEHTSELQSLMPISDADCCLQTNKQTTSTQ